MKTLPAHDHLGFKVQRSKLVRTVFIPRYYDPRITEQIERMSASHNLMTLGSLVDAGHVLVATGDEIGKLTYGTGVVPFIRTSDIANWELKTDSKQGVSPEVYERYAKIQDVQAEDILFVRDGTYLIGSCCLLTEQDTRIVYQSHILKFRVQPSSPVSAPLLLALLNAPIVKAQIRAKQLTADIIDTLGNRYTELILPVPKAESERKRIATTVQSIVKGRRQFRERLRRIPLLAEGLIGSLDQERIPDAEIDTSTNHLGFNIKRSQVRSGVLLPRYYDPMVDGGLGKLRETHDLQLIGQLVTDGILQLDTGVEVGKMEYGTGSIPFIRTSDIINWELKIDPKQSVSESLYDELKTQLDLQQGDIFLVRDGTYLVGTSCILTAGDTKIAYCGGIYKIRVKRPEVLDPYLLLALLNTPIVMRQIRAKQFTRDVIEHLAYLDSIFVDSGSMESYHVS